MDLRDFKIETFEPLVGTEFRIVFSDTTLRLVLATVTDLGPGYADFRPRQFSLQLTGGEAGPLEQRQYEFVHDTLGTFEMFISPKMLKNGVFQYEAIFT